MKAQRRHELRENDLIHFLASARDYFQVHGGRVGMVALLALAVFAVVTLTVRSRAAAMEDVWRRRSQLRFDDVATGRESLEALRAMTAGVSDRSFILASLLEQGRQALRMSQQVPDAPERELTEQAQKAFSELIDRFPGNPLALGVGLHGLTSVEENLFVIDDDPQHKERARAYLTRIIGDHALDGMPFQKLALSRRDTLDTTFTKTRFHYPPAPEADAAAADISIQPGGVIQPGGEIEVHRVEPVPTP